MAQIEHLKKIIELSNANPNLKIKFLVSNDCMCDDYGYSEQLIFKVEIEDHYLQDELIVVGEDDIREVIYSNIEDDFDEKFSELQIEEKITEIYKKEVEKIIAVYTQLTLF